MSCMKCREVLVKSTAMAEGFTFLLTRGKGFDFNLTITQHHFWGATAPPPPLDPDFPRLWRGGEVKGKSQGMYFL